MAETKEFKTKSKVSVGKELFLLFKAIFLILLIATVIMIIMLLKGNVKIEQLAWIVIPWVMAIWINNICAKPIMVECACIVKILADRIILESTEIKENKQKVINVVRELMLDDIEVAYYSEEDKVIQIECPTNCVIKHKDSKITNEKFSFSCIYLLGNEYETEQIKNGIKSVLGVKYKSE